MKIEEMIKKYNISIVENGVQIRVDMKIAKHPADVEFVKSHKQEIMDFIRKAEKDARARLEERKRKIEAIEGLNEIRAAMDDMESWRNEFKASFKDVGGLGVRPKPEYDFPALFAKYPKAAAYLKAESFAFAHHDVKAAAGKLALERIIEGEDYEAVIADMESEWSEFCMNNLD